MARRERKVLDGMLPIDTNLKVVIVIGNVNCIAYYLDIFKIR